MQIITRTRRCSFLPAFPVCNEILKSRSFDWAEVADGQRWEGETLLVTNTDVDVNFVFQIFADHLID